MNLRDTIVVIFFALLGFAGSVVLYYEQAAPIMVAVFLATSVASLVYRFLGGIGNATLTIGAAKVGGSIAALIGVAITLNGYLVEQRGFRLQSDYDLNGEWKWVYGAGGWDGQLTFTREKDGNFTFVGMEYRDNEAGSKEPIYQMTNGKAVLTERNTLELESDVFQFKFKDKFHWKSTAPFVLIPAFRGKTTTDRPSAPAVRVGNDHL